MGGGGGGIGGWCRLLGININVYGSAGETVVAAVGSCSWEMNKSRLHIWGHVNGYLSCLHGNTSPLNLLVRDNSGPLCLLTENKHAHEVLLEAR